MNLLVAVSQVKDGSMLDRNNPYDQQIFSNRKKFLKKHNIDINSTTRVRIAYHEGTNFCRYDIVNQQNYGKGMIKPGRIAADGLVTSELGHALFLPLGDCLAAAIYEPNKHILMLSHLGRHSIEQNGGVKSINFLANNFDINPAKLKVWLSPAAGGKKYPLFNFDNRSLKEVASEQLKFTGVQKSNIEISPIDTTTDARYFSHSEFLKGNRPNDGRFAIVALMK